MKLLDRTMVNLGSSRAPDLLGHITLYELDSGDLYYIYYIENRYYASKEVCKDTKKILRERGSDNDYHYNVDIFFNDKERHLGWSLPFNGTHFSD